MNNLGKKTLAAGVAMVWGAVSLEAMAANLNAGDILTITQGVNAYDAYGNFTNVSSGSYFGMDSNGNGKIAGTEKTAVSQGTSGLVIGATTTAGASHGGAVAAGDTNAITAPWSFFGNTGSDYVTTAVTGSTTVGLNFSGWTVTWNGIAAIPMNSRAWETGYTDGVANITWDGVYGHAYTLDYSATVPAGDPSGFGNVKYHLHLVGTVTKAPTGAPSVASSLPANGAASVAANLAKFVVTFDKAMDTTTINSSSISITSGSVTAAPSCTTDKMTCVFPVSLSAAGAHTVSFAVGPKDTAGNALTPPGSWSFTSVASNDTTAPTVSVSPTGAAVDSTTTSTITLTFSEAVDPNTVASAGALTLTKGSTSVSYTLSTSDDVTYTVTPSSGLSAGATYTVALSAAVKDLSGNALSATSPTFTTLGATTTSTSTATGLAASGGAGGGCAANPASRFDISLLLAALGGLGFAARSRKRS